MERTSECLQESIYLSRKPPVAQKQPSPHAGHKDPCKTPPEISSARSDAPGRCTSSCLQRPQCYSPVSALCCPLRGRPVGACVGLQGPYGTFRERVLCLRVGWGKEPSRIFLFIEKKKPRGAVAQSIEQLCSMHKALGSP